MLMYGRNQLNIVKQLSSNQKKKSLHANVYSNCEKPEATKFSFNRCEKNNYSTYKQ